MRRTFSVLVLVVGLAISAIAPATASDAVLDDADFEVEYMAAPAVAGVLLEAAGLDNRYGQGRDGGNYIRDIAHAMGEGTDFFGISKSDVALYQCAVADFLITQGAEVYSGTGVIDPAASGATAVDNADGTVTLAIAVVDECGLPVADLSPTSDFYVMDSVIGGPFYFGTGSIPGSAASAWSEVDGTYSVTLDRNLFSARPAGYNDGWYRLWSIYVDGQMVQEHLELKTTYWAVGNWAMDLYVGSTLYERFIIIDTHVDGDIDGFFGIGYDPAGSPTGTITGAIDGRNVQMHYERTDIVTDYEAWFTGTIAVDGNSMSGTWSDTGSIANQPWSMTRQ